MTTPIELLEQLKQFAPETVEDLQTVPDVPIVRKLMDIKAPEENAHDELIRSRYLCRGGAMLLVSQSGIGKSSFTTQAAINFAVGKSFMGIEPTRAHKILVVQAENDDGDTTAMRDGVLQSFRMKTAELKQVHKNIDFVYDTVNSGMGFLATLRELIQQTRPDIVIIDPALSFMGVDSNKQSEVTPWLRNGLNPILNQYQCGLILVHHTPKPPKENPNINPYDQAYAGTGSAEFTNWARAVLTIQRTDAPGMFKLIAAKRGQRLGWKDEQGQYTIMRTIAHHTEPGVIAWREPEISEIMEARDQDHDVKAVDVLESVRAAGVAPRMQDVIEMLKEEHDMKQTTARARVKDCEKAGLLTLSGKNYSISKAGDALLAAERYGE